jgi:cytoskeleton protein RodZ
MMTLGARLPMTSVGEILRRERMRRNLDLDTISRETKISSRFLNAIETEQFDKLPGGVFARSFVRQYARLLELDDEELVSALDRLLVPGTPELAQPQPAAQKETIEPRIALPKVEDWQSAGDGGGRFNLASALPAAAGVILVMLACSFIYGWWQRSRQAPSPPPEAQHAAQNIPPPTLPPSQPPAPAQQEQPATPVPANPVAVSTSPERPATPPADTKTVPVATPPAAPKPAGTLPPSPPSTAGLPVRVQVTAQEPTWLLVRSDGKFLFSGTLDTNESRTVEGSENVLVRLGNAGGVTMTYNGKPIGAPGPKGQVRTIQFTSGGFQAVGAVPAAPKPAAPLVDPL